jgi:hypothetical protein
VQRDVCRVSGPPLTRSTRCTMSIADSPTVRVPIQIPGIAASPAAQIRPMDPDWDLRPPPRIPNRPLLPMPTTGRKEDMDAWLLDCAFRKTFFGSGN